MVVVGGGPAGSTAAKLLASWGHSVVIVDTQPPGRRSLAESLPASTRKVFSLLGQIDAVEATGFHPNFGNVARWAGKSRTTSSRVAGYHVSRVVFDRVLRRCAANGGASLMTAAVKRVTPGTPMLVQCQLNAGRPHTAGQTTIRARYVLDCSGRAGVVARGLGRVDVGYRTLAIAADWELEARPEMNESSRTFIESAKDGWAWLLPFSPTRRQCTVMIDPERATRRRGLTSVYHQELAKSIDIHARLESARQISSPWSCDASVYRALRTTDGGVLLVGDAASFIEPLSSAGVKKALVSAWRAAVVVNTCLARSEMTSIALDFYERRERAVFAQCLARSTAFFKEASDAYAGPFWDARAREGFSEPNGGRGESNDKRSTSSDEPSDPTEMDLAKDLAVYQAFERLRQAEITKFTASAGIRFEPVATIEGNEVVLLEGLVLPGHRRSIRFAAGISLPDLLRLAVRCESVADLLGAYCEHAERERLEAPRIEALLGALSFLVARRALVHDDT